MGSRRVLRRPFKATLAHGSPRFQHVRYLDARIFLHRGWWLRQLPGCKASDLLRIALDSAGSIRYERRRAWEETRDSPSRDPKDVWDQHRNARMQKCQPLGNRVLYVESVGWAGGE